VPEIDIRLREADYRRVIGRLNELSRDLGDLSPVMRDIAGFLHERTLEGFAAESAPDGTPWKPLAPATLREKRKAGYADTILQRTRNLRDSIHSTYDGRSAAVGTNEIYAAIHQFGGEIEQSGRQQVLAFAARGGRFTSRATGIPARPFLGFRNEDGDAAPGRRSNCAAFLAFTSPRFLATLNIHRPGGGLGGAHRDRGP
jgi:phage virion morphogenesis protein